MPETQALLSHFFVKVSGADASEELLRDLVRVTVESSLHLPDVATLEINDPRLRWIDDPSLAPGKTIIVSAQTTGSERPLFSGEIVEIESNFAAGTHHLVIRAFDRLHRLARGQHVRSFQNVTDEDILKRVANEAGLQVKAGPMTQVYAYVFQNNETNLAFLQARAAALGYLLYVQDTTLHCEPPQSDGQPIELEWGPTLREFRPRLTTIDQLDSVTVRGWDPATRQEIVGRARESRVAPRVGQAQSGGALAHQAYNLAAERLVADRPVRSQAVADRLAQAVADRHAGSFVEAEGASPGNPGLVAGATVRIGAVGERFGGTYFVTSATHIYSARSGYVTEFGISGLHPATLLSLLAPPGPARTTPAQALVIGVVTDNRDPDGQGRIKVKFPWLSGDQASDWARVVSSGGGAQRGIEFLPEVNDEVLVGLEMGDIHYPYVLGGLWNGKDAPPKASGELVSGGRVQQRVIRSRAGHTITLDDGDGGGGITLEDKNGNKVRLDAGANALTIEVRGDASIKAQGNLTLEAQGQVQLKGMGVQVDGGASTVDVKGSLINLN